MLVGGNIKSKTINGVTTTYTYGDSLWKDLLTGYGSETFTYDTIGNPLTWRGGATMTWEGRRLATYTRSSSGLTLSFAYNADGIRTKKVVNGSTYEYTLDGSKIVRQKNGNQIVYFAYDAAGNLYSMTTGGTTYYYVRNMQGDILGLNDASGNQVASYTYDPWGNITSVSGSNTTIANLNPFRYRGYYYDFETGLYYLQSRYYDPVVGRFISADGYLSTGQGIIGYNMFAYCLNNPINYFDPNGCWTISLSLNLNVNIFFGASIGIGFAFDDNGNFEFQWGYINPFSDDTLSIGLFDIGGGISAQYTNRDTVDDLYGPSLYIGGSAGASSYVGGDAIIMDGDNELDGFQITAGYGYGVDFHINVSNTLPLGGENASDSFLDVKEMLYQKRSRGNFYNYPLIE